MYRCVLCVHRKPREGYPPFSDRHVYVVFRKGGPNEHRWKVAGIIFHLVEKHKFFPGKEFVRDVIGGDEFERTEMQPGIDVLFDFKPVAFVTHKEEIQKARGRLPNGFMERLVEVLGDVPRVTLLSNASKRKLY